MGYEYRVLGCGLGFWVLGFGFRVLVAKGFTFRVLGFGLGFRDLAFGLACLDLGLGFWDLA